MVATTYNRLSKERIRILAESPRSVLKIYNVLKFTQNHRFSLNAQKIILKFK